MSETSYDSRGLMSWVDFLEKRVKPHYDKLDAWDTTILKSVHSRWQEKLPAIDIELVKSDVTLNIGFISDEELAKRLEKLENLGLLRRMVGFG